MKAMFLPPADKFISQLMSNLPVQENVLKEFCQNNDIEFISYTDVLRKKTAEGSQVYFTFDQHWTPEGHSVIADILCSKLKTPLTSTDKLRNQQKTTLGK